MYQHNNIYVLILVPLYIINFNNLIEAATVSGSYIACYEERNVNARLMYQDYAQFRGVLTPELCIQHCRSKGFAYAGVEFGFECFCSKFRPSYRYLVEEEECSNKCEGDKDQTCGGPNRMNAYEVEDMQENPVQKNYVGCVNSSVKKLLVDKSKFFNVTLTPERCVAFCYRGGYMYAGLTNGECLCGDTDVDNIKQLLVSDDECDTKCGHYRYTCGGPYRTSIYTTGITGYNVGELLGCYEDNPGRVISGFLMNLPSRNTPKLCYNYCRGFGYKYAGVQIGNECHCGNLKPKALLRRPDGDCSSTCPGDSTKRCGGAWRINVYAIEGGAHKVEPGYLGCFYPDVALGTLDGSSIMHWDINSPETCIEHCRGVGFKYAGLLQSVQCVCGNRAPGDEYVRKEFECTMECPGDPNKECGALARMSVYDVEGEQNQVVKHSNKDSIINLSYAIWGNYSRVIGKKNNS